MIYYGLGGLDEVPELEEDDDLDDEIRVHPGVFISLHSWSGSGWDEAPPWAVQLEVHGAFGCFGVYGGPLGF